MPQNTKRNTQTDEELIALYKERQDKSVLAILFERYMHLLYGLCLKYLKNTDDAQDAVMQIFEKLSSDLLKHEVDYFKGWIYSVGRNYCLMELRRRQSVLKHEQKYDVNFSDDFMEFQPELHLNNENDKEQKNRKLTEALAELNTEQRQCIELFYLQEKSYKEVVEITGFEMKKVKSYIQNGKRNLKILLSSQLIILLILKFFS